MWGAPSAHEGKEGVLYLVKDGVFQHACASAELSATGTEALLVNTLKQMCPSTRGLCPRQGRLINCERTDVHRSTTLQNFTLYRKGSYLLGFLYPLPMSVRFPNYGCWFGIMRLHTKVSLCMTLFRHAQANPKAVPSM